MVKAASVPRVWRERIIKYRLIGGKCEECGKSFYPLRPTCPSCGSEKISEVKLPEEGRVVHFTVIRSPPREFGKMPYIVALIELKDGTRLIAQVVDVRPEELEEGTEVEAVFRRYRSQGPDGIIEYGVKFRPKLGG